MNFYDQYRFLIKIPGVPITSLDENGDQLRGNLIYPKNADLSVEWERDKDFRFFRWEIGDQLLIVNEPDRNRYTFNEMVDLEISASPCQKVDFFIEKKCKGDDQWSEFWNGSLSRYDRDYDMDDCVLRVTPTTEDEYSCMLSTWNREYNIFNQVYQPITAQTKIGEFEIKTCYGQNTGLGYLDDCIDDGPGWAVLEHSQEYDPDNQIDETTTIWVREYVVGGPEPVGGGWEMWNGRWVRKPIMVFRNRGGTGYGFRERFDLVDYEMDNGVLLNDILEGLVAGCYFSTDQPPEDNVRFVSNFFGINPDGTQPDNDAYTAALENLQHLCIWQITDVAKMEASQNATKGLFTWKKLMKDLKTMFNVDFFIDANGTFRLEHWSYFRKEKRLDLTQEMWVKFIRKQARFKFRKTDLPYKEIFKFPEETKLFFDGAPIEYDVLCSDPEKEETNQVELFITDFQHIVQNKDEFYESPLFFMANLTYANGLYSLTQETNPIAEDNETWPNGHLSWPNLLYNYHRHGRPQPEGLMNQRWEKFLSFKFMKKHGPISFPLGCCDLSLFEPEDLVRANFGWEEIEKASYSLRSHIMELELTF